MPPKRTKAKRSSNYNTKLRKAQAKNRLLHQSLQNTRKFPTTAAGFFRLSIHSHFEFANALGVPKGKTALHLAKTHGRAPKSILLLYNRICSDLEKYGTFDCNQLSEGEDAEEEDTDEEGDDDQNDQNDDDDDGFDLDADAYVSTKAGKRKAARQLQPPTRAHRNRRLSLEEEEDD